MVIHFCGIFVRSLVTSLKNRKAVADTSVLSTKYSKSIVPVSCFSAWRYSSSQLIIIAKLSEVLPSFAYVDWV